MKKLCNTCNRQLNKDQFPTNAKRVVNKCKQCKREYDREWYHRKKKLDKNYLNRKNSYAKQRASRNAEFVFRFLLESAGCAKCDETNPVLLEFHHLYDKKFNISDGVGQGFSIKRLEKEIKKCEILCVSCHRKQTALDRGYYSFLNDEDRHLFLGAL